MLREILLGTAIVTGSLQGGQTARVAPSAVRQIIKDNFGTEFESLNDIYRVGDFNGDGKPDIAIALHGDSARNALSGRGVTVLNTDPFDGAHNGKPIAGAPGGINCLGLGIVFGYQRPASEIASKNGKDRYYTYDCFSDVKIIPKISKVASPDSRLKWKETKPTLKGDALLLDEETGGTRLVYWTGETFRGFPQRGGD